MTTQNKILERIKHLLALSASPNEHEAAAAAAQAQRLMLQHKIEQAMLDTSEQEPLEAVSSEIVDHTNKTYVRWKANLASGVAKANGCHVFMQGVSGVGNRLALFGKPSDIATAKYMYAYLVQCVDRLTRLERDTTHRWRGSFRLGVADTIRSRMATDAKLHEMEIKRSGAGAALVRVQTESQRVKNAFDQTMQGARSCGTSRTTIDPNALAAGRAAGHSIDLSARRGALSGGARRPRQLGA